jgi:hypothetical protein
MNKIMQENQKPNQEEKLDREVLEREAALFAKSNEVEEARIEEAPKSLGKAQVIQDREADSELLAGDIGWKNVPLESLPSLGMFYPEGAQIAIRAASVAEIRHWSTIDEDDLLGIDDMLNFIIEKCCRFKVPGRPVTYKDLKEIDRFYLIFAVRDFTFKNGENKLNVTVTNNDGVSEKIEVTKDVIDYFNADERLLNYYSEEKKCFILRLKSGEEFDLHLPSLGVMMFIKSYVNGKRQSRQNIDKAFMKYAPFLFPEWRTLTTASYEKALQDSIDWSLQKISVLDKIVEILSSSVDPKIKYINSSGEEATAELKFPGGFKSIFLISDIFGELV